MIQQTFSQVKVNIKYNISNRRGSCNTMRSRQTAEEYCTKEQEMLGILVK